MSGLSKAAEEKRQELKTFVASLPLTEEMVRTLSTKTAGFLATVVRDERAKADERVATTERALKAAREAERTGDPFLSVFTMRRPYP